MESVVCITQAYLASLSKMADFCVASLAGLWRRWSFCRLIRLSEGPSALSSVGELNIHGDFFSAFVDFCILPDAIVRC